MSKTATNQATLLFETPQKLDGDKLGAAFADIANSSDLGTGKVRGDSDRKFEQSFDDFDVSVEAVDAALPGATFNGAIGANPIASQRAPLAQAVADHTAHVKVSVVSSDKAREGDAQHRANMRLKGLIFAQDVTRTLAGELQPVALHWHSSNMLVLPIGLMGSEPGRLYMPLCLKLKCTTSAIEDTDAVNMAQEVTGAADLIGKPMHIMAPAVDRKKTFALAAAFLDRMLDGGRSPHTGAIFRDRDGHRVKVINRDPFDGFEDGLLALVQVDHDSHVDADAGETSGEALAQSRELVSARAKQMKRRKDGPATIEDIHAMAVEKRSAKKAAGKELKAVAPETRVDESQFKPRKRPVRPTTEILRNIRARAETVDRRPASDRPDLD